MRVDLQARVLDPVLLLLLLRVGRKCLLRLPQVLPVSAIRAEHCERPLRGTYGKQVTGRDKPAAAKGRLQMQKELLF